MPLYVDLDGSLFAGDLLWESLLLLVRLHPFELLGLPRRLLSSRARFKAWLAQRVVPDPGRLPYRRAVLAYLAAERARGRPIILATASNEHLARAVADHLRLFDDVLASDESRNLKAESKLSAIRKHAQGRTSGAPPRFEYVGDSRADLPVWKGASAVTLAVRRAGLLRALEAFGPVPRVLEEPRPRWRALVRALRPHQWSKNALIFAPILLAHRLTEVPRLLSTLLVFACFCALASATYVINDLLDIESDRAHPGKKTRPLAAGQISIPTGLVAATLLLIFSLGSAWLMIPTAGTLMLLIYLGLTLSYSIYFKQHLFLDVLLLAGLYTHRVLTGGVAASVELSPWLLAFSTFFFLSLALAKRSVELHRARERETTSSLARRAYRVADLELVEVMGVASGYISVLVLGLFVSSQAVTELYAHPERLWLMSPIMLYWISRIWFMAHRGELDDDPVLFATRDGNSYLTGLLLAVVVSAATW